MILHPAAYWLEGSLVVVPFIVALAILATGLVIVPFRIQRRRARLRL
jgi:hypothetical protein